MTKTTNFKGGEKKFYICCLSPHKALSLSGSKLECYDLTNELSLGTLAYKGQPHLCLSILDLITAHYTLTFHFIKIIDLTSHLPSPTNMRACTHMFILMKQTCFRI